MFTELEQLEINALRDENSKFAHILDRYNEEQEYMLSSITHELRNPMTLIYSTVQLMESRNPEVKEIHYWNQIKEDIHDTILLLQDFSLYNHSDDINTSEVNLFKLFQELAKSFEATTTSNDINIILEASNVSMKNIEKYICDYIKLKQAFTNILKNAIEAISKHGTIHIDINAETSKLCKHINGNTYMIISITNNGPRILEDELYTMFKPFVTFKPFGSGIGLPISYKIITNHGGTIHVTSDDELTCFEISLPLI